LKMKRVGLPRSKGSFSADHDRDEEESCVDVKNRILTKRESIGNYWVNICVTEKLLTPGYGTTNKNATMDKNYSSEEVWVRSKRAE